MKPHLWLIRTLSGIVPRRFRSDWRQEWEAELHYHQSIGRPGLLRRSLGSVWDALAMQPRRLEDEIAQDLRFGLRMLRKEPGFALLAVAALAIGIGMNTAIFSLVNAALLEPLPFKNPDQLVRLFGTMKAGIGGFSPVDFLDWKAANHVFDRMAAFRGTASSLGTPDGLERVPALEISADFLPLLGVEPERGRNFLPEEDQPGSNRVVILSHATWSKYFGSDAGIIGKTITIDTQRFEVVGVMQPGFEFGYHVADLWMPLRLGDESHRMRRTEHYLQGIGRLKPEVPLSKARKEMDAIAERLALQNPVTNSGFGILLMPLRDNFAGGLRPSLRILLTAAGVVLLIACCNFTNLLLSRTASRHREIAVRLAIGARPLRVIRQWLTETALLTAIAAGVGVLLANWTIEIAAPALKSMGNTYYYSAARLETLGLSRTVIAFTVFTSIATVLISGLLPAIRSAGLSVVSVLKEGSQQTGTGIGQRRVRHALIVSQVSLTVVLLMAAGLLINSFGRLLRVDLGFNPDRILTMTVSAALPGQAGFHDNLIEQIERVPGVQAASIVDNLPLMGIGNATRFTIEDRPPSSPSDVNVSPYRVIGPEYFRTLGVTILRGREFTTSDTPTQPAVVIINETMGRTFWAAEDPVGRRIRRGGLDGFGPWLTIIGIVRDVNINGPASEPRPEIYFPHAQFELPGATNQTMSGMNLVIRAESEPLQLAPLIRAQIREVDRNASVANVRSMEQVFARVLAPRRLNMALLSVFAGAALLLAAIGIYGTISYSVAQRAHEIGVRIALGAERRNIFRLVMSQGARLALVGIVIGVTVALAVSRWMSSLLFGIGSKDPLTLAVVVIVEFIVALIACYIPARHAMAVDPLSALKQAG